IFLLSANISAHSEQVYEMTDHQIKNNTINKAYEHKDPTNNSDIFILNVVGDSMIEAGILDGDKVIVRSQTIAENGDIIVAMTEEDEATVKRFYKEKNRYRLQPENSTMEPIYLDNVAVIGKVIGLYREM
ncbi:S24 family peptidase, partial [Staphylococcus aureus]|uniref:S24 family peptidase n=1 Tax=Staphylococcus aureus TaxID=1280 RepID=UPI0035B2AABE